MNKRGSLVHDPAQASNGRYTGGCRCLLCKAAHAAYTREWASKNRAKVEARRWTKCPDCGGRMTQGNGTGRNPDQCLRCYNAARRPEHGTRSRYQGGCRCYDCRRANREYMASLKGQPAPNHGYSGYRNYGCRCDACRAAARVAALAARREAAPH